MMIRTLFTLALLTVVGCANTPSYPLRSHTLGGITAERLPGGPSIAAEATFATWRADAKRLAVDMQRAVKRSNWGLLELTPGVPGRPPHTEPARAEALMPDNRVAVIYGWALNENEVAAAVVVGRFGDPAMQAAFLQMLADTLADKPKPVRDAGFTLP